MDTKKKDQVILDFDFDFDHTKTKELDRKLLLGEISFEEWEKELQNYSDKLFENY